MEKIRVLYKRVGRVPSVIEIPNTLEAKQKLVGGYIEMIRIPNDTAVIICNEEAKLLGMEPNLFLLNESGIPYDVVCGDFIIVDAPIDSEDFGSLSDEQIRIYTRFCKVEYLHG